MVNTPHAKAPTADPRPIPKERSTAIKGNPKSAQHTMDKQAGPLQTILDVLAKQ